MLLNQGTYRKVRLLGARQLQIQTFMSLKVLMGIYTHEYNIFDTCNVN
jgi:hypothetical protein